MISRGVRENQIFRFKTEAEYDRTVATISGAEEGKGEAGDR